MAEKEKMAQKDSALWLGVLALGAWVLGKKPPPEEEKVGAACEIRIIDVATGLPVPHNSPALVLEGSSYLMDLIVTNQSTRLGAPVSVNMDVTVTGLIGGVAFQPFPIFYDNQIFAASQALSFKVQFTIPAGSAGKVGEIVALMAQPAPPNAPITSCSEPLTIESAVITYRATCTISVL